MYDAGEGVRPLAAADAIHAHAILPPFLFCGGAKRRIGRADDDDAVVDRSANAATVAINADQ